MDLMTKSCRHGRRTIFNNSLGVDLSRPSLFSVCEVLLLEDSTLSMTWMTSIRVELDYFTCHDGFKDISGRLH